MIAKLKVIRATLCESAFDLNASSKNESCTWCAEAIHPDEECWMWAFQTARPLLMHADCFLNWWPRGAEDFETAVLTSAAWPIDGDVR